MYLFRLFCRFTMCFALYLDAPKCFLGLELGYGMFWRAGARCKMSSHHVWIWKCNQMFENAWACALRLSLMMGFENRHKSVSERVLQCLRLQMTALENVLVWVGGWWWWCFVLLHTAIVLRRTTIWKGLIDVNPFPYLKGPLNLKRYQKRGKMVHVRG